MASAETKRSQERQGDYRSILEQPRAPRRRAILYSFVGAVPTSLRARIHACDFFCIIDALTSASMLPGVNRYIEELPEKNRLPRSRAHAQYVKVTRGAAWLGRTGCRQAAYVRIFSRESCSPDPAVSSDSFTPFRRCAGGCLNCRSKARVKLEACS